MLLPSEHEMEWLIYLFMDGSSTLSSLNSLSFIVLLWYIYIYMKQVFSPKFILKEKKKKKEWNIFDSHLSLVKCNLLNQHLQLVNFTFGWIIISFANSCVPSWYLSFMLVLLTKGNWLIYLIMDGSITFSSLNSNSCIMLLW